jgi:Caspase domain
MKITKGQRRKVRKKSGFRQDLRYSHARRCSALEAGSREGQPSPGAGETVMRIQFLRSLALFAAACIALSGLARAQTTGTPSNRLALVIGQSAYSGDQLQTAANDAAIVAKALASNGFDVTELHELDGTALEAGYRGFLDKARAAPPGAAITVYLAGLGVAAGCDDYLLPVDAHIRSEADIPRIALSMSRVMSDLAQLGPQANVVLLDGARPIPPSITEISLPKGLLPLTPPRATSFGLSAEIHDFEVSPKPGDEGCGDKVTVAAPWVAVTSGYVAPTNNPAALWFRQPTQAEDGPLSAFRSTERRKAKSRGRRRRRITCPASPSLRRCRPTSPRPSDP